MRLNKHRFVTVSKHSYALTKKLWRRAPKQLLLASIHLQRIEGSVCPTVRLVIERKRRTSGFIAYDLSAVDEGEWKMSEVMWLSSHILRTDVVYVEVFQIDSQMPDGATFARPPCPIKACYGTGSRPAACGA